MTTVYIKWHGPYLLNNIIHNQIALNNSGIYAIYRQYIGYETLLYVGKTKRSFLQRLSEHEKQWLSTVRGELKVRFGVHSFSRR